MITVTERAARQVQTYMAKQAEQGDRDKAGLRLGIRGGGCSGLEYVMELSAGPRDTDQVLHFHGLDVYVDPKSLQFLEGTELDFEPGIQNHGFQLKNPREKSRCGCGQSFSV